MSDIKNMNSFGKDNKTWSVYNPDFVLPEGRKMNRIIGLTFPASDLNLGLEPSILTVMPQDKECEYSLKNIDFDNTTVKYYLCSVYISGMQEFKDWASRHDIRKIVVGGYHPTTFPEEFINYAYKIVTGPCDSFWETIAQEGQIVAGITRGVNVPRYDLYNVNNNQQVIPDKLPTDVCTSIHTSQGCPMKCDFCCSPIMCPTILSKPVELIEKEIQILKGYNPRFLFIRDENFPLQKDWQKRLEIIASTGAKIYLFASANLLTESMVQIFAANNVYMVCLGLENINDKYAKNHNLDEACKLLQKYGIYVYLSFIVNPFEIVGAAEGKNFYQRLLSRFEELKPAMVCGNFLMPFRGTALWDKYYHLISEEDYKEYNSKSAFLIKNKVVRAKMEFFMFYYQNLYYKSKFYNEYIRTFNCGDTLSLRFKQLERQFIPIYERYWNERG